MKAIPVIIIIVVVILVAVGGYFMYQSSQYTSQQNFVQNLGSSESSQSEISSSENSSSSASLSESVNIQNFKFSPTSLTIKAGTTVTWTNSDSAPHTIKSAQFNSPVLATSQTFSFKFITVGIYDYSCGIHPSMTGKIIVTQ